MATSTGLRPADLDQAFGPKTTFTIMGITSLEGEVKVVAISKRKGQ